MASQAPPGGIPCVTLPAQRATRQLAPRLIASSGSKLDRGRGSGDGGGLAFAFAFAFGGIIRVRVRLNPQPPPTGGVEA